MQRLGQAAHPSPGITHTTREKAQPQGGTRGTSHSREAGASSQLCWGGKTHHNALGMHQEAARAGCSLGQEPRKPSETQQEPPTARDELRTGRKGSSPRCTHLHPSSGG